MVNIVRNMKTIKNDPTTNIIMNNVRDINFFTYIYIYIMVLIKARNLHIVQVGKP